MFCRNSPGTCINVSYSSHQAAAQLGIRIKATTLQSTINKAKSYAGIFHTRVNKELRFNKKLLELLILEAKDIA